MNDLRSSPSDSALAASAAASLLKSLPDEPGRERRINDLYLPIFIWLSHAVAQAPHRPLVAGISSPQGSGKSTLAAHLVSLFAERGMRAATVSIDDFYLRNGEQKALAAASPGNPYLKYRGSPGTHDVGLGADTIDALRGLDTPRTLRIPTYDKTAFAGRGDRFPEEKWRLIEGPLDLVLVEGWILGFQPFDEARVADEHLREVNRRLRAYDAWTSRIERMVICSAAELEQIVQWRIDAEERSVRAGRPGLDRAATEDYIRRFIPEYWLYADTVAKGRWSPDRQLVFRLDPSRLPLVEK